jgi:hypothetical protein
VLLSEGGDSKGAPPVSSVADPGGGGDADPAATSPIVVEAVGGPAAITGVVSFDPADRDGAGLENEDQAARAIDGNPSTEWTTSCYNDKYFNGKPAVGLIVALSAPGTGSLTIAVNSAPYQLSVYGTDATTAPQTMADWGSPIAPKRAGSEPATVAVDVSKPATFLLVRLIEAGTDAGCTAKYPYRGRIGDIAFG